MINFDQLYSIPTPLGNDNMYVVHKALNQMKLICKDFFNIYDMEISFNDSNELKNYMNFYEDHLLQQYYGVLYKLRNFPQVKMPNFITVGLRPPVASNINYWHVILISRIGKNAYIFDPDYESNQDDRIHNLRGKTKIIPVLNILGIRPHQNDKRIYIGGGYNMNGSCRSIVFDFMRNLVYRLLNCPEQIELDQINPEFFYNHHPYRQIKSW
ncbi:hypothetical protein PVAND_017696 [Polypedilum vanderplanki]|uniref:Uncharacterized protein n=1 Tax=Polypedilum vanderplanki TaxID=319348 RepID=A0A9J6B9I3_POLVA|nr:hypothetical protein PVAND_017696 [Polypedilum vanderplanki]